MTAEQIVASVVGSAALEGHLIDPEWRRVLLRVAVGDLSGDDAVRMAIARVYESTAELVPRVGHAEGWLSDEVVVRYSTDQERLS